MYININAPKEVMIQNVQGEVKKALGLLKERLYGENVDPADAKAAGFRRKRLKELLDVFNEKASGSGLTFPKVKGHLDTCLQNAIFLKRYNIKTPAELGLVMDENPLLLGFNNGVYSFKDMRFYTKVRAR